MPDTDKAVALLKSLNEARDLETIPMTRGQLVELLATVNRADGMNIRQAEIHARMRVDQYFIHLKSRS